jgi:hypothetical protein
MCEFVYKWGKFDEHNFCIGNCSEEEKSRNKATINNAISQFFGNYKG